MSVRRVSAPGRVVGVERGENEVAGERGADCDLRGLEVADFADHDDVGILAEHMAQRAGERQADLGVRLHLVRAGHLVFDRVLDRDDTEVGELILRRNALSEVDLPEPVGPVTRMMPCG